MPLSHVKALENQYLAGTYNRYPVLIERGSGAYLIDRSNKRYLDLLAGIGVNALGYNHPRMLRILRKQIKRPLHVSNLLYHEYQGRLAQRLAGISGLDRVFFTNSGAEAVEGCLKFARIQVDRGSSHTPKQRILAVEGAFHGRTFGALSVTAEPKYRIPFEPLVPGVEFVKFNDANDLQEKFSGQVCAVILEVIQGEGGVRPISEAFYRRARHLTRETGAALICDEVQCGLGRTGRWLAVHKFAPPDSYDDLPDLVSLAKPLGGGIPMGAVLMKESVSRHISPGLHGTTFGGGPLACRVSLELLKVFEQERLLDHAREMGDYFRTRFEELLDLEIVKEVRGDGLMLALQLSLPTRKLVGHLLEAGFIANSTRETVLRVLPPLIIRKKQIDKFIEALRPILQTYQESP